MKMALVDMASNIGEEVMMDLVMVMVKIIEMVEEEIARTVLDQELADDHPVR